MATPSSKTVKIGEAAEVEFSMDSEGNIVVHRIRLIGGFEHFVSLLTGANVVYDDKEERPENPISVQELSVFPDGPASPPDVGRTQVVPTQPPATIAPPSMASPFEDELPFAYPDYQEPQESPEPPGYSSEPPAYSSEPPAYSSEPPAYSSEPPAGSSDPPAMPVPRGTVPTHDPQSPCTEPPSPTGPTIPEAVNTPESPPTSQALGEYQYGAGEMQPSLLSSIGEEASEAVKQAQVPQAMPDDSMKSDLRAPQQSTQPPAAAQQPTPNVPRLTEDEKQQIDSMMEQYGGSSEVIRDTFMKLFNDPAKVNSYLNMDFEGQRSVLYKICMNRVLKSRG